MSSSVSDGVMSNPIGPEISLVIPCLNEQESIPYVMGRLRLLRDQWALSQPPRRCEILVVDDGSTDRSPSLLAEHQDLVRVLRSESPQGYGAALHRGFREAQGKWIGFFDLDSTYDPVSFIPMHEELLRQEADIVYGRREFWGPGMPFVRGFGNFLFSRIVRLCFGRGVDDIATGMRIFKRERLQEALSLQQDTHFDFGFSFTIWTLLKKWKIAQVPISYGVRQGESKLMSFKDGLVFFRVVFQMMLRQRSP